MSITQRSWSTPNTGVRTLTFNGYVDGARTELSVEFQAKNATGGVRGPLTFYADGVSLEVSWNVQERKTSGGVSYITKMYSDTLVIMKPFFTLKLADPVTNTTVYEKQFSFYEIEKAPASASCTGGMMDGSTVTKVKFSASAADASYKVNFQFGGHAATARSDTGTVEYTFPESWCDALPEATIGRASATCQVLYGGVVYASFPATLYLSVPPDVAPVLRSVTLADREDTPVPPSWKMLLQKKSGLRVADIDFDRAYGSPIRNIKLEAAGQTVSQAYSYSNLPVIETVYPAGTMYCTVTITDARGRSASKKAEVTFLPYSAPVVTGCRSERSDEAGTPDNEGSYFVSTTGARYSDLSGRNPLTVTVRYKKTDEETYGEGTVITPGTNICGGDLEADHSYDVLYTLSDQFTTVTYHDYISTAAYLVHFLRGGQGLAVGKKASLEGYFDCAMKALFRSDSYFLTADGDQVNIRDIIPLGTGTPAGFSNGMFLAVQNGKLVGQLPPVTDQTPTTLTNSRFLYVNNGKIGARTIPLSATTDGVIKAGDSISASNVVANGFISNSSKDMYFEVPVGRLITAESATVTGTVIRVRTIDGLAHTKSIASGGIYHGIQVENYSPVCELHKTCGSLRVKLYNQTGWTKSDGTLIRNDTPISVSCGFTIHFA